MRDITDLFKQLGDSVYGLIALIIFSLLFGWAIYVRWVLSNPQTVAFKKAESDALAEVAKAFQDPEQMLAGRTKEDKAGGTLVAFKLTKSFPLLIVVAGLVLAVLFVLQHSSNLAEQRRISKASSKAVALVTESNTPGEVSDKRAQLNELLKAQELIKSPEILINVANIQSELGKNSESIASYNAAYDLASAEMLLGDREKDSPIKANIKNSIATVLTDTRDYARATEALLEASRLNSELPRPDGSLNFLIHFNRGRIYYEQIIANVVQGAKADEYADLAAKEYELCEGLRNSVDAKQRVALRVNQIALMQAVSEPGRARQYLALGLREADGLKTKEEINLKINAGVLDIGDKKFSSARTYFREIYDVVLDRSVVQAAIVSYNLAECEWALGNSAEAKSLYTRAISQGQGTSVAARAQRRIDQLAKGEKPKSLQQK